MMWKWIRPLAVVYIVWEIFLSPDTGLIQSHAQSACSVYGAPGGTAGSKASLLGTQKSDQALITGGCIDGTVIGGNTQAAGNFTTETTTGNQTATGARNIFGTSTSAPAHLESGQTTAPALTSCGTGSPTIVGTDTVGIVTMGTSATGCVITFNRAYTGTPYCLVTWIATPLASQSYVTSNLAITTTQTSTSGNILQYLCIGTAGG